MSEFKIPGVEFLIVLCRPLGCTDESASDEEQAEKILYFYPENSTIDLQLTRVNMLEGLIDFSSRFSVEPISTVVMDTLTWAFYECEPSVWIIMAVYSKAVAASPTDQALGLFNHQPNSSALVCSLQRLYELYLTFNGSVLDSLQGPTDSTARDGWEIIVKVKSLRKEIRKLGIHLQQLRQDNDRLTINTEAKESDAVVRVYDDQVNAKQSIQADIDSVNKKISEKLSDLRGMLFDAQYTPLPLRNCIAQFLRWYMASGELSSHTSLQVMMHRLRTVNPPPPPSYFATDGGAISGSSTWFAEVDATGNHRSSTRLSGFNSSSGSSRDYSNAHGTGGSSRPPSGNYSGTINHQQNQQQGLGKLSGRISSTQVLHHYSTVLLRIRRSIDDATQHQSLGSIIIRDHRLLWSDFTLSVTHSVMEFIRLQDAQLLRGQLSSLMEMQQQISKSKKSSDKELENVAQNTIRQLQARKGFVTRGWETLDLDGVPPGLLDGSRSSHILSLISGKERAVSTESMRISELFARTDVLASSCEDWSHLYCPRIYMNCMASESATERRTHPLGRALLFRHSRIVIVIVLPDWGPRERFTAYENELKSILRTYCAEAVRPQTKPTDRDTVINDVVVAPGDSAINTDQSPPAPQRLIDYVALIQQQQREYASGFDDTPLEKDWDEGVNCHGQELAKILSHSCLLSVCAFLQVFLNTDCMKLDRALRNHDPSAAENAVKSVEELGYMSKFGSEMEGVTKLLNITSISGGNSIHATSPVHHSGRPERIGRATSLPITFGKSQSPTRSVIDIEKSRDAANSGTANGELAPLRRRSLLQSVMSPRRNANSPPPVAEVTAVRPTGAVRGVSDGTMLVRTTTTYDSNALRRRSSYTDWQQSYPDTQSSVNTANQRNFPSPGPSLTTTHEPGSIKQLIGQRQLRIILVDNTENSFKVFSLNRKELHPLFVTPVSFRDHFASATLSGNSSTKKMIHMLGDKLSASQSMFRNFPASGVLLASCIEPAVMRALNDVWSELDAQATAAQRDLQSITDHAARCTLNCVSPKQEACIRVATVQRGGIWVTGRRLETCGNHHMHRHDVTPTSSMLHGTEVIGRGKAVGGCRFCFMIINQCATMNEMFDVFEDVCRIVQLGSRS